MRGVPGSGKSTKAKELINTKQVVSYGQIFSADDFWHLNDNGDYSFDVSKLGYAHEWNRSRVAKAVKAGLYPIVVDNTFIKLWELRSMKDIIISAIGKGYEVEIVEPETKWWIERNAEELFKRCTHGVPLEVIQKMLRKYVENVTIEQILE